MNILLLLALLFFMISNVAFMVALWMKIDHFQKVFQPQKKNSLPKYENPPAPPMEPKINEFAVPEFAKEVYTELIRHEVRPIHRKPISNGFQFKLKKGAIVNVYTSGKVLLQGIPDKKIEDILSEFIS